MLDLTRLHILQQLSVHRTITATAAALGYSTSAVSQQLATLERDVGAALFDRTARSIGFTDAGRLLLTHAVELLHGAERAQADLNAQAGRIQGHLTVTVIPNLAAQVAVALAQVLREHPALDIVMRETTDGPAVAAVVDHLSDLAITDRWSRSAQAPLEGLSQRTLRVDPVGLAVSAQHPAAALSGPLGGRDLAAVIAELTWLCAPAGYLSRVAGDERLARLHATPRRRWEFEGLITIAELVALDTGGAFLPQTVADTQPRGQLALIPLTPAMTRRIQATTRTSSAVNPAIGVCRRAIVESLAKSEQR